MKYKCIVDGDKEGGIFEVKFTKNSVILKGLKKPFFTNGDADSAIWNKENKKSLIKRDNTGKHCLKEWDDGTFTIYFYRSGTPYYFELLKEEKN